jgi:hypothetical protein
MYLGSFKGTSWVSDTKSSRAHTYTWSVSAGGTTASTGPCAWLLGPLISPWQPVIPTSVSDVCLLSCYRLLSTIFIYKHVPVLSWSNALLLSLSMESGNAPRRWCTCTYTRARTHTHPPTHHQHPHDIYICILYYIRVISFERVSCVDAFALRGMKAYQLPKLSTTELTDIPVIPVISVCVAMQVS